MRRGEGPKVELRFLISTKAAGVIIGKGGENIQRIREEFSVKVMIPDSNGPERVLVLDGELGSIIEIFLENLERGAPPKGSRQNYDARDADENTASEYGGWGVGNQNSGLGMVQRRNNMSGNPYSQAEQVLARNNEPVFGGNVLAAAGLFGGGGPGVTVAGRTGNQAAVTQALAGSLPHASAAAMLAATGGQTAGGPNAGPAGDAAATAAAMMAAGLMRG